MRTLVLAVCCLLKLTPLATLTSDSTLYIQSLTYDVVARADTPKLHVLYGGTGLGTLTIVVKNGTTSLENKKYTLAPSTSGHEADYDFYKFTANNQTYKLEVSLDNGKTTSNFNINVSSGVVSNYNWSSTTRTPVLTLLKKRVVDNNNVTTETKETLDFNALFTADTVQNRLFTLNRYAVSTANAEITDFSSATLTLGAGPETDFCNSSGCELALEPVLNSNTLTWQLTPSYCYSRSQDKMGLCSTMSNGYRLKNLVLRAGLDKTQSLTFKLKVLIRNGNTVTLNLTLPNVSINKELYGTCTSALYCVASHEALTDIVYQKEVSYP